MRPSVFIASSLASIAQAISLWDPTGPYHVGYTQHIFDHITPNDTTKPGTFMLLTIYYPTRQIPNTTVPYLDEITSSFYEATCGLPNGSLSKLTTHLQFQAPTLINTDPAFTNGTSPYPTLFFTPGAGLSASAYTAYISEMASYGYAVVAIDHPGEAPYLPLPYTNGTGGVYGYPNFSDYPPTLEEIFSTLNFRITDILAAASDAFFPALVRQYGAPFNLTHFGVFGHSIGGAAAAAVMASNDSVAEKFKAGANLDGTFFQFANMSGEIDERIPVPDLKLPFLEIAGEQHFGGDVFNDPSWVLFNRAQSGWLRSEQVNGTRHLHFSDILLWIDLLDQRAALNGTWEAYPAGGVRVTSLVNALLREFFGSIGGKGFEGVGEWVGKAPEFFSLLGKGQ